MEQAIFMKENCEDLHGAMSVLGYLPRGGTVRVGVFFAIVGLLSGIWISTL